MRTKSIIHLLVTFLIASNVQAAPRTRNQARDIAQNIAKLQSKNTQDVRSAKAANRPDDDDQQPYYIFNYDSGSGFVVISGDDEMPDVIGYSDTGNIDEDNLPVAMKGYLEQYAYTLEYYQQYPDERNAMLRTHSQPMRSYAAAPTVKPLMSSLWGQGAPFNNLTPEYSEGAKCAIGCTATSMAQILYYYKYPEQLLEDIPSYVSSSLNLTMPVIEKGVKYDWSNMKYSYSEYYNEIQAQAVATLMWHCANAIRTNFYQESGADAQYAVTAYKKQFGMDKELVGLTFGEYYTAEEWVELLNNELINGRPIQYGASNNPNSYSGHSFVIDGVNSDGYYHVNWGWDGTSNGYFDINVMKPFSNDAYGYVYTTHAIVGIAPDNGVEDEKIIKEKDFKITEWNGDMSKVQLQVSHRNNETGSFQGNAHAQIQNIGVASYTVTFSVGILGENGELINIGYDSDSFTMNPSSIWSIWRGFNYPIPAGTDRLYIIGKKEGETEWKIIDGNDDYPIRIKTTATDIIALPVKPGVVAPTNGVVDNLDIVALSNIIHKTNTDKLNADNADANEDGWIDGCDIVAATNIMLGKTNDLAPCDKNIELTVISDNVNEGEDGFIRFAVSNPETEITMIQTDVILPNGYTLKQGNNGKSCVALERKRAYDDESLELFDDHVVTISEVASNIYRVLIYSDSNMPFSGDSGDLFKIKVERGSSAAVPWLTITNTVMATPSCQSIKLDDISLRLDESASVKGVAYRNNSKSAKYSINGMIIQEPKFGQILISDGKKYISDK